MLKKVRTQKIYLYRYSNNSKNITKKSKRGKNTDNKSKRGQKQNIITNKSYPFSSVSILATLVLLPSDVAKVLQQHGGVVVVEGPTGVGAIPATPG